MKVETAAVVIVVAALALPLGLLAIAACIGVGPASMTDVSALASIMAAVFTVGGLVVALVSFYTMARIKKVARKSVESALADVDVKIEKKIQNFLEAYSSFTIARNAWASDRLDSFSYVEAHVTDAENTNPSLRGMNTFMAEVYFVAAQTAYFQRIGYDTVSQIPQPLELSASKGIERFRAALTTDDVTMDATFGLELAQLYALIGERPGKLAYWIKKAKGFGNLPTMDAEIALVLFSSCKNHDDIARLVAAYEFVPMTGDDVLARCWRGANPNYVQFIAFADKHDLQNQPVNPFVLTMRSVDGFSSAEADWRAAEQPHYTELRGGLPLWGEYDVPRGYQERPGFEAMDTLLPKLLDRLTFIVPLR